MFKILFSIIGLCFAFPLLKKVKARSVKIDTESIAEVIEVIPLGMSDLQRVCAIKYKVLSSEPFELLVTPCNKKEKLGKTKTIFYEKENPNENYYFKSIGRFDRRFFSPICMFIFSLILLFSGLASL